MKDAAVLAVAIAVGFFMLSYDQRTDDTGVEVALLVALSLALAVAAPRDQPFWDLVVGISGLALADDWVPTYHALGWTHLTRSSVRGRLETFVGRALADVDR